LTGSHVVLGACQPLVPKSLVPLFSRHDFRTREQSRLMSAGRATSFQM
jgi:hypothetical protein